MLGEQTLGAPSAQLMIPASSSSNPLRYELGNFGRQTLPSASEEHDFVFGVALLESLNRAISQQHVGELEIVKHENSSVNGGMIWETLPDQIQEIAEEIARSRYILDLESTDDEIVCNEETWSRAATLLSRISLYIFGQYREKIEVPRILPGPDGSIDIHWDELGYELLINIPADPKKSATFYGDNRRQSKFKGSFDPKREDSTASLAYLTLRNRPEK
jgi:hypothetical protein